MERAENARPCLSLGRIVATPGSLDFLAKHGISPTSLLWRHQHGDWGQLSADDVHQNELAVRNGQRVLSNYAVHRNECVWIITEWDRSVTTVLLPSEY
jgi:hypothetical protein